MALQIRLNQTSICPGFQTTGSALQQYTYWECAAELADPAAIPVDTITGVNSGTAADRTIATPETLFSASPNLK